MTRLSKFASICFLNACLAAPVVRQVEAQVQNGSLPPALPSAPRVVSSEAKNEIKVHANEVIVPVTVLGQRSEPVLDLIEGDFHVFDDGVEQKIVRWDLDGDPLSVALLLETSTHIKSVAPAIHRLAN